MSRIADGARLLLILASFAVLSMAGCGEEKWCKSVSGEWDLLTDLGDGFPNYRYEGSVLQQGCDFTLTVPNGTTTYGEVEDDVVKFPIRWLGGTASAPEVFEAHCKAKHVTASVYNGAGEGLGCVREGETTPVAASLFLNCLTLVDSGGTAEWEKVASDEPCPFDDDFAARLRVSQFGCSFALEAEGGGIAAETGLSEKSASGYAINLQWPAVDEITLPAGIRTWEIQKAEPCADESMIDWKELSDLPTECNADFRVVYFPTEGMEGRCNIRYRVPILK